MLVILTIQRFLSVTFLAQSPKFGPIFSTSLSVPTVKSGCYLAYVPNVSTTATYVLDNETRGLASSILPNPPPIMMLFDSYLE